MLNNLKAKTFTTNLVGFVHCTNFKLPIFHLTVNNFSHTFNNVKHLIWGLFMQCSYEYLEFFQNIFTKMYASAGQENIGTETVQYFILMNYIKLAGSGKYIMAINAQQIYLVNFCNISIRGLNTKAMKKLALLMMDSYLFTNVNNSTSPTIGKYNLYTNKGENYLVAIRFLDENITKLHSTNVDTKECLYHADFPVNDVSCTSN